ncbi:MAG: hypothetical protein Q9171_006223 [Xanthocarpia ochracea]
MGVLSKILPDPAFRYFRRTLNPPKAQQDTVIHYSDTLIILKVPKDEPGFAFRLLQDFVSSVHNSCPQILRCETHIFSSKHMKFTIHITLRFSNNTNAMNLQVDGLLFKDWLEQWEAKGLWTCHLYHEAIKLLAGFDRGSEQGDAIEKRASESDTLVGYVQKSVPMQEMSEGSSSNSNSPVHAAPFVPMYSSPHGGHGPMPNQMNERQRHILELTAHSRQNFVPPQPMNGGGPRTGHFDRPTKNPFQRHNGPRLHPVDHLNPKQREAHDLIIQLDEDKKVVLRARMQTAAALKRLISELENLEATQCGTEHLRFIYPMQHEIAKQQGFHDAYGREWVKVEELLEICWAELMVPGGG